MGEGAGDGAGLGTCKGTCGLRAGSFFGAETADGDGACPVSAVVFADWPCSGFTVDATLFHSALSSGDRPRGARLTACLSGPAFAQMPWVAG